MTEIYANDCPEHKGWTGDAKCPYCLEIKLDRYKTVLDLSNEEFNTLEAYKERLELRLSSCRKLAEQWRELTPEDHTFQGEPHGDVMAETGKGFATQMLLVLEGQATVVENQKDIRIEKASTEFNAELIGTDAALIRRVTKKELEDEYGAPENQEPRCSYVRADGNGGMGAKWEYCLERAQHDGPHRFESDSDRQEPPDWAVELDDLRNGKD